MKMLFQKNKILEKSNKNNFKSFEFINYLILLSKELSNNYACFDLIKILENYYRHNFHYMVYLINMKSLTNSKKHTKKLNKILISQLNKIFNLYLQILKK